MEEFQYANDACVACSYHDVTLQVGIFKHNEVCHVDVAVARRLHEDLDLKRPQSIRGRDAALRGRNSRLITGTHALPDVGTTNSELLARDGGS